MNSQEASSKDMALRHKKRQRSTLGKTICLNKMSIPKPITCACLDSQLNTGCNGRYLRRNKRANGSICIKFAALLTFASLSSDQQAEAANLRSSRAQQNENSRAHTQQHARSSEGPSFNCPPDHNGYYPTTDCKSYYWCSNGSPASSILYSCANGLLFDVDTGRCDWEQSVHCSFLIPVPLISLEEQQWASAQVDYEAISSGQASLRLTDTPTKAPVTYDPDNITVELAGLELTGQYGEAIYFPDFVHHCCIGEKEGDDAFKPTWMTKDHMFRNKERCCTELFDWVDLQECLGQGFVELNFFGEAPKIVEVDEPDVNTNTEAPEPVATVEEASTELDGNMNANMLVATPPTPSPSKTPTVQPTTQPSSKLAEAATTDRPNQQQGSSSILRPVVGQPSATQTVTTITTEPYVALVGILRSTPKPTLPPTKYPTSRPTNHPTTSEPTPSPPPTTLSPTISFQPTRERGIAIEALADTTISENDPDNNYGRHPMPTQTVTTITTEPYVALVGILHPTPKPTLPPTKYPTSRPTNHPTTSEPTPSPPPTTLSPTISFQPTRERGIAIEALADTTISENDPNNNYGRHPLLLVDGSPNQKYDTLLKFDLSFLESSVSFGKVILRIFVKDAAGGDFCGRFETTQTYWTEDGITWMNAPTTTAGVTMGEAWNAVSGEWFELDVTGALRWVLLHDKQKLLSIRISSTEPRRCIFASTNDSDHIPHLFARFLKKDKGSIGANETAGPTSPPTPPPASGSMNCQHGEALMLLPSDDATITKEEPILVSGKEATLVVTSDGTSTQDILLKFDITEMRKTTPRSGVLMLHLPQSCMAGGVFVSTSRHENGWTEDTVSWSTAPTFQYGGNGLGNEIGTFGELEGGQYVSFNVIKALSWETVTYQDSLTIRISSSNGHRCEYTSKEGGQPPKLVIEF